ncbi:MAG: sodium:calcium antiporter, partial [Chromatiaceae bacterium]|nr:sodium:calcium antiporter [Chromatiaceae bacterium]
SRYGDAIADKTGLGGTWIGVVMLASVTSLPELVTGVSSVTVADTPDIAVGDVLGSCVFNLLLIVLLDFLSRDESVYRRASQGHILAAGFGIMLIGIAGFNLLLADKGGSFSLWHMGLYSPAILILYAISMRSVFLYEAAQIKEFTDAKADAYPELTLRAAVLKYIAAAAVVLIAGVWLPFIAKALAHEMGWYQSFVGTLFVAFVTSLPEMVVTVAALRLGAVDMAIGNLFGSNLFNIGILAIDDILFLPGPLFDSVSATHAISAFSAIMMTGVAIVGLLYRPRTRVLRTVGWASIFLFTVYLLNAYILYLYGEG